METVSLNPRIKLLWISVGALIGLVTGSVLSGMLYPVFQTPVVSIIGFLFLAFGGLYGWKRYSNWGFRVQEDHLYIEHGVLKKTYSMVPYVRVQHIDTDRGPLDRILGLSTLRVYTAGSKGADIKIPGLERNDASELQETLRDQAISSEKGFDAV